MEKTLTGRALSTCQRWYKCGDVSPLSIRPHRSRHLLCMPHHAYHLAVFYLYLNGTSALRRTSIRTACQASSRPSTWRVLSTIALSGARFLPVPFAEPISLPSLIPLSLVGGWRRWDGSILTSPAVRTLRCTYGWRRPTLRLLEARHNVSFLNV